MPPTESVQERSARIAAAFRKDGFEIVPFPDPGFPGRTRGFLLKDDRLGMLARHTRAHNTKTGAPKRVSYVEGDGYHMGWLIGAMAEPDVARMAGEFVENVTFAFFGPGPASQGNTFPLLKNLIVRIIAGASERMLPDIPPQLLAEIDGIVDGCREVNPKTTARRDRLLALNLGIDCLLAHVYTGTLFSERGVHPGQLRMPIGCNAFSISGDAAGGRHWFGRDFMFPTADVFQDTAWLIVQAPETQPGEPTSLLFVSQGAPGLVGTTAAMNTAGVAVGVNMLPSRLCSPRRPGLNSLLLIRDCVQHCGSAPDVVERIKHAPRGVSWLYPVADAAAQAFVVEAGRRLGPAEPFPHFEHLPDCYRLHLPDLPYFLRMRERYGTPAPADGMLVRGREYNFPDAFLTDWNEGLWREYNRNWLTTLEHAEAEYSEAMFGETGFINPTWKANNCPGPFFFAPQRTQRPDVLIATNHCVSPEMRLTSMSDWIAFLAGGEQNDMQWRYDELNSEIFTALLAAPIDEAAAWDMIDFLRPDGKFPQYYNPSGAGNWREIQVHGSVTLCELTSRTFTSLFGYYGDEPVTLHLGNFGLIAAR